MDKKYAYVTFMFEADYSYLKGLYVLAKSLKDVKSKYPLVVVIPKNCSDKFIDGIKKYSLGSEIIVMDNVDASLHVKDEKFKYWELTVFRFNIARLTQFEKVVMVDSDLLIVQNIDDVFDYPHLSGVCSAQIVRPDWDTPNGGLLVFCPSISYYNELISSIDKVRELTNNDYNDQDVFDYTRHDWKENLSLHIPEEYNEYWRCAGKLAKTLNRGWKDLKVLHYWGTTKIWNYGTKDKFIFYLKSIKDRRFDLIRAAKMYWRCLKTIKKI